MTDEPAGDAPRERSELRLALGMRGGVSLAVWIGGACAEIDALRRATRDGDDLWSQVLAQSDHERVTVDVMAGASAGGLNGVLFAAAIRHGFPMEGLLGIWREVAAVQRLTRRDRPWLSLFDGDVQFLDVIRRELERLVAASDPSTSTPMGDEAGYVDLQLSATLVEPLESGATSPGDEKLRRRRSSARFHFRHDPAAALPRCDLEEDEVPRLAVAARASASFPVAFEAAVVRSTRPAEFEAAPQPPDPPAVRGRDETEAERDRRRLVDCRGRFSESRGSAVAGRSPVLCRDDDFVAADGGVVDNIPLGKALDAVRDAPADGPTRRVLVYLHPTGPTGVGGAKAMAAPGTPAEVAERRRSPRAVLQGAIASRIEGESIDGDLERLEAQNRAVRRGRALRRSLLADLTGEGRTTPPLAPSALAEARLGGYRVRRADAEADAVRLLLSDPLAVLGEDPFPVAPPVAHTGDGPADDRPADDRWRSPLAAWTLEQRLALDAELRGRFTDRVEPVALGENLLFTGLGPVQRAIHVLLELAREAERTPGVDQAATVSAAKPALYSLGSLVRELVRVQRMAWVARAGLVSPDDEVKAWVDATLNQIDLLCTSGADWDVVEPAPATGADRDGPSPFQGLVADHLAWCAENLQLVATGGRWSLPEAPAVDLRGWILDRLGDLAGDILVGIGPGGRLAGPAEAIRLVLAEPDRDWRRRVATLEVLFLDEHLQGAPGRGEIDFVRMSAAAPVVHAARFEMLHRASQRLNRDFTCDGHHLVPDVKLAGNELANFSAFLDERWRANDWLWGRLDAAATLVDLLLGPDPDLSPSREDELLAIAGTTATAWAEEGQPPSGPRERCRRALTARRQGELLGLLDPHGSQPKVDIPDAYGLPSDLSRWQAGLETLRAPGTSAIGTAAAEVAGIAAAVGVAALPRRVPFVVVPLRWVLRGVARRFTKPTGALPD